MTSNTTSSDVSRSSLLSEGPAGVDLAARRAVVAAATRRGRVSISTAGDLRSLDFWSDGDHLVLLAASTDSDAPMTCLLAGGDDAIIAWTDLLAEPRLTAGSRAPGAAGEPASAAALVEAAVAGSDPSVRCTVVVVAAPGQPARALVRSTTAAGTSWGEGPADQPIDLRTGADATYWAAALAALFA